MMKNAFGSSSSMWKPVGSSNVYNNQEIAASQLTEEELERQYASYKSQFEEWITKNRNHPDRDAYNRYVNQFKEWEAQVEVNRKALREWKERLDGESRMTKHADESTSRRTTNGASMAATASETSSPPLSLTSKDKKKKKKKKKDKNRGDATDESDNPMMAMMKMMTAMAAATTAAAAPPPMPMDPMSMMMAMSMMMPMMMNSAPVGETTSNESATAALPDLSKPPPGFSGDGASQSKHSYQGERDREFRADRSRPFHDDRRLDRSPVHFEHSSQNPGNFGDQPDGQGRGDYWYQRWLANRQQHQPAAGTKPTVDPWLPTRQPTQQLPLYPQSSLPSGPVPLLPPRSQFQTGMTSERDHYNNFGDAGGPFVNRSGFGARDFSMRKPQNHRQWN